MFLHNHPYEPFLFDDATKLIVGTLPPPRFTTGDLKNDDVDFCYGSRNGLLWPILNEIFNLGLVYENTQHAVEQRLQFLLDQKIGVCDIVQSAQRSKIDASDIGMQHVRLRDILKYLERYKNIETILFMGGNSKNGPEYFFRKVLKTTNTKLEVVSHLVPRIYRFKLANQGRSITTVSLTAPSGAANRAIGSMPAYRKIKDKNPNYSTFDFRVSQYKPFF